MINDNHVSALHEKHEALDKRIDDEMHRPFPDTVRITELKRRKLRIKEEIKAMTRH